MLLNFLRIFFLLNKYLKKPKAQRRLDQHDEINKTSLMLIHSNQKTNLNKYVNLELIYTHLWFNKKKSIRRTCHRIHLQEHPKCWNPSHERTHTRWQTAVGDHSKHLGLTRGALWDDRICCGQVHDQGPRDSPVALSPFYSHLTSPRARSMASRRRPSRCI